MFAPSISTPPYPPIHLRCPCACVLPPPSGQELHQQLDKILEAHRAAAEALTEKELSSCNTDVGDYNGTCSSDTDSDSGSSSDGSNGTDGCDSEDASGSVCKDAEEQKYKEQLDSSSPGSSIGTQEGGAEAEGIEGSHKEAEGGAGDRHGKDAAGSSSGNGKSSGGLLSALKKGTKGLLGGSGGAKNSSTDEEMKVGASCRGGGWAGESC